MSKKTPETPEIPGIEDLKESKKTPESFADLNNSEQAEILAESADRIEDLKNNLSLNDVEAITKGVYEHPIGGESIEDFAKSKIKSNLEKGGDDLKNLSLLDRGMLSGIRGLRSLHLRVGEEFMDEATEKVYEKIKNDEERMSEFCAEKLEQELVNLESGLGQEILNLKTRIIKFDKDKEKGMEIARETYKNDPDRIKELEESLSAERKEISESLEEKESELREHPLFEATIESKKVLDESFREFSDLFKETRENRDLLTREKRDLAKKLRELEKLEIEGFNDLKEEIKENLEKIEENITEIRRLEEESKEFLRNIKEKKRNVDTLYKRLNKIGKTRQELSAERKAEREEAEERTESEPEEETADLVEDDSESESEDREESERKEGEEEESEEKEGDEETGEESTREESGEEDLDEDGKESGTEKEEELKMNIEEWFTGFKNEKGEKLTEEELKEIAREYFEKENFSEDVNEEEFKKGMKRYFMEELGEEEFDAIIKTSRIINGFKTKKAFEESEEE